MNKCKTCGGAINRTGNYYVCEFCGNKWEIDSADDVHAVDRANAWSALRDSDFEKAAELFENIIVKETENHEAYWGRALALAGIVYVTDMDENKKVPTCNNITEDSFINSKDVQKAISLAPADIADGYGQQAEYIEKVRIEWLEKASKEPAYDVFISFKDSDRENGIERTQDSVDAQDLYNALIAEGYKVFFSRISLRDKVSEQYEPYIYNAIKTAKVMIVFGEKPEYFSAVWLKNEWSRFVTRIRNGEKHKNSLVVVYKNMNPGDLPVVLKSRQCLNASDMTFLSGLNRHIKRVIDESKMDVHIEKIKIKGGQVAKKATTLSANTIQTREVGLGAIAETDISERQSLDLMQLYLKTEQWDQVNSLAETVLFNNPTCAEAIWYKLLAEHKITRVYELPSKLSAHQKSTYSLIEKVLDCAPTDFAENILAGLYQQSTWIDDSPCALLLQTILPYAFSERQEKIDRCMNAAIQRSMYQTFSVLLTTLDSAAVDTYIDYHLRFAKATSDSKLQKTCLDKILEVDEGNLTALEMLFMESLKSGTDLEQMTQYLEKWLQFVKRPDAVIKEVFKWLVENATTFSHYHFSKKLLQYYSKDIDTILDTLQALAERLISNGAFETAEYFLQLILSKNQSNPKVFWDICLVKTKSRSEKSVIDSKIPLSSLPEYTKYLTMVDQKRQMICIELDKKQKGELEQNRVEPLWAIAKQKAAVTDQFFNIPQYEHLLAFRGTAGERKHLIQETKEQLAAHLLVNVSEYKEVMQIARDTSKYKKVADYQIQKVRIQLAVAEKLSRQQSIFMQAINFMMGLSACAGVFFFIVDPYEGPVMGGFMAACAMLFGFLRHSQRRICQDYEEMAKSLRALLEQSRTTYSGNEWSENK